MAFGDQQLNIPLPAPEKRLERYFRRKASSKSTEQVFRGFTGDADGTGVGLLWELDLELEVARGGFGLCGPLRELMGLAGQARTVGHAPCSPAGWRLAHPCLGVPFFFSGLG